MSSTLYRSDHLAPVINLAAARAQRRGVGQDAGDTLMVRCVLVSDDTVYRWVGIHEHTTIAECRVVVATVFGIDGSEGIVAAEAEDALELRDVLRTPGDSTAFTYGLWQFGMQLADVYPRDESTPPSVCVAGSGSFGDTEFNIAEVNAELLGVERVKELESLVRADAREVIGRATTHDFVPLIQALGVERGPADTEGAAERARAAGVDPARLAKLPLETEQLGRDAFWATTLAAACCADETTTSWLTESIMRSLGWEDMDADTIRALCAASLAELDEISADMSVAERLDIYRDLLRG